jgi:hypothetical protein
VIRNKSSVIIVGHIALPPEAVEGSQQASMFLVNVRSDEFDNRRAFFGLAQGTKTVAEYGSDRFH